MKRKSLLTITLVALLALTIGIGGTMAYYTKSFTSNENIVRAARFTVDTNGTLDEDRVFDLSDEPLRPGIERDLYEFEVNKHDTETDVKYDVTIAGVGSLFNPVWEGDSPVNLKLFRKVDGDWVEQENLELEIIEPADLEQFKIGVNWDHNDDYDIRYQGSQGKVRINVVATEMDEKARIESLQDPASITVTIGETVEMPATVTANMSDGTTKEVAVSWSPAQIDTSTVGTKTAIGIVDGFDDTANFIVVVEEEVETGNVTVSLYKDSKDKVDFELIKGSFYIKNKATGQEFREGTSIWNAKQVHKMRNIPVGEYTIHYELPHQLSTKKVELGGAYNETIYDPQTNPLVVEDLGSKENYVKITIKADTLIKEIRDMESLVLPKDITYEDFWATKPDKTIIVDENDVEHEVEVRISINKYNFEAGRDKGYLKAESDTFDLPLYVSNTEPAMRLRTWLEITFVD